MIEGGVMFEILHSLAFSLFQTRSTGDDEMLAELFGFDRGLVKVSVEGLFLQVGDASLVIYFPRIIN